MAAWSACGLAAGCAAAPGPVETSCPATIKTTQQLAGTATPWTATQLGTSNRLVYSELYDGPPQVQQRLRWEAEWRQQHPGQPLPNAGQMQKLHQAETQANINAGFARMRAQRQAQLQHDYLASRAHQQSILDRQHVKWTPAQWQAWDRQYDQSQRAQADAYREGVRQAGEIHQAEREHDEQQRIFKSQH